MPSLQCEIRLLTLSCRRDALPVGQVCLVGSRGGVRTVLYYVRIIDRFFSKARCVCRVVLRSGTFRLPVSEGLLSLSSW